MLGVLFFFYWSNTTNEEIMENKQAMSSEVLKKQEQGNSYTSTPNYVLSCTESHWGGSIFVQQLVLVKCDD